MSARELITEHLDLWTGAITKKSSSGRGSNGKIELTGVKKLRELILELAVRGKLVPQSPEGPSAASLLADIEANKKKLHHSKIIKKPKQLSQPQSDEAPWVLPNCWEWVRLPNIYYPISPSGKKLKSSETLETGQFPVVDQGQSFISGYTDDASLVIEVPHPVIVFGDHTTARKYIDFDFVPGADGTKILCPILVNPRFFYLQLLGYDLENRGYARHFKVLNENFFALPPLEEQHRIVQKVDELMALCDRLEQQTSDQLVAHETLVDTLLGTLTQSENATELADNWARLAAHFDTLFTTEQSIDKLKQTILQLAVMGRLVEQDVGDEPASRLLKQLEAEVPTLVEQGIIKRPKSLPIVEQSEKAFPIPKSWIWARLGNIGVVGSSRRVRQRDWQDHGIPFYRAREIVRLSRDGWVDNELYISESLYEELAKNGQVPEADDLMITGVGTIGVPYIVGKNDRFYFKDASVLIFKNVSGICPQYLYYFCHSPLWVNSIHTASMGTTVHTLTIVRANLAPIPLPPIDEQYRIVQKVDELMALCDQLKERLNQASETRCQLAKALVEGALTA